MSQNKNNLLPISGQPFTYVELQRHAKAGGWDLPTEVALYMMKHILDREKLKNALMQVFAFTALENQELSIEIVSKVLGIEESFVPTATPSGANQMFSKKNQRRKPLLSKSTSSKQKIQKEIESPMHAMCFGIIKGFLIAVMNLAILCITCLVIDVICYQAHILTMTVPWLWWTVISLNALSMLVPIDIARYLHRKYSAKKTLRSRFSLLSLWSVQSALFVVFLNLIYIHQSFDESILHFLASL